MISLDTNVVVRFLVRDDAKQARAAKGLVERLDREDERAHVSDIVLCELVWVLRSAYRMGRLPIARALRQLVAAKQLVFESHDAIQRAIHAYETGHGDFADYVIREHARGAGCDSVATFDQVLLKDEHFSPVR